MGNQNEKRYYNIGAPGIATRSKNGQEIGTDGDKCCGSLTHAPKCMFIPGEIPNVPVESGQIQSNNSWNMCLRWGDVSVSVVNVNGKSSVPWMVVDDPVEDPVESQKFSRLRSMCNSKTLQRDRTPCGAR